MMSEKRRTSKVWFPWSGSYGIPVNKLAEGYACPDNIIMGELGGNNFLSRPLILDMTLTLPIGLKFAGRPTVRLHQVPQP